MNKKKVALVLFVFIVLIAYAGYLIIRIVQNPTVTFFVEKGDLTLEESTVGYILRSETLVKGENYKNGIVKIKNEGEKVSKGEAIFRYYSNGEEAIRKQIKEVNDKIDKVFSQESKVIPKDIKTLEDQITSNLDKLYQLNDLKKIAEHKKEMNQYITKKSQIIGEQSPAGSYLKELMNQKADLENRLSANREYITAPNPGVISYRVDGLENVLTTTNFDYLNKDFLEGLDIKNAQVLQAATKQGK